MFPTITTTQQFTISPKFLNRLKKPAPVENATYKSSDESVASVVPASDGMSALVVAQGVGTYTVSVSADADLGDGVKLIVGQDSGEVILGEAVSVGFTVGSVEEQP